MLDFGKGFERSRWNTHILKTFCEDIRENSYGWELAEVSDKYLMGILHQQLKRSREYYRMVQPRFLQDKHGMETMEDVLGRVQTYNDERSEVVGSRSRQKHVEWNLNMGSMY